MAGVGTKLDELVLKVHAVLAETMKERGMVVPAGWGVEGTPTLDAWCVVYEAVRTVLTSEIILRLEKSMAGGVPVLFEHMQQECKLVWDGKWRYADPLCKRVFDVVTEMLLASSEFSALGTWVKVNPECADNALEALDWSDYRL